jgi:hypothetical protein
MSAPIFAKPDRQMQPFIGFERHSICRERPPDTVAGGYKLFTSNGAAKLFRYRRICPS